ncbi:MAG: 5'-nucleotidase C-terminal domain-containing protein [Paludibacteraceae bacterium]|jgi:2',3'-cyclic-nucleotide 2'-phosphodiesterase (5'-nucleotidase family)|nr:5'-nucleotidase C-terminal domain-containing protein [Paludibacteraceae bacterium]
MAKNISYVLAVFSVLLQLMACTNSSPRVQAVQMDLLSVDSTLDSRAEDAYAASLRPYAEELSATMDAVIGYAPQTLKAYQPESPLSNWTSDVLREAAIDFMGRSADIGVVNMGGLRCEIPAGEVTLRKMYELMPFDNQLTIVWMTGADLDSLCQSFAAYGGQGVSGLTFCIKEDKAYDICVNGLPIKPETLYSVATNDYLVAGNDGMQALTRHKKRQDTGVTIRDIYIAAVKKKTAHDEPLVAEVEGRLGFCSE